MRVQTPAFGPVRAAALLVAAFPLLLGGPRAASAQDVEILGQQYGTRPPAAYYQRIAQDPGAFEFSRAWSPHLERVIRLREALEGEGTRGGALPGSRVPGRLGADLLGVAGVLGQREGVVEGTFRFPMVMGLFQDSPDQPPYDLDAVNAQFVDGPNPNGTIVDFYREVSGGRVTLVPETQDWVRVLLTQEDVTGTSSGLGNDARVGEYIVQVLAALEAQGEIDWGRYDTDGPDGIPTSGDDDGFVDVLAIVHPTWGAECGGSGGSTRVWSHRWSLRSAFDIYVTGTPSNAPENPTGFIRVNDYTIQPAVSCNQETINEIGVFAHELGHGFGLPDLYAVGGNHGAVGSWGLMASGSWGCQGGNPSTPCHMGAWSKEVLGWAEVVTVDPESGLTEVTLDPVESGGILLRMDAQDGSGDYFLLENRQRIGYDADLHDTGLLIWQVTRDIVDTQWSRNRINSDPDAMGVWIRQADGLDDLSESGGGRGDPGDIYPGETGNTAFHAGTSPASETLGGMTAGATVLDIEKIGEQVRFKVLNRYQTTSVRMAGASSDEAVIFAGDEEMALDEGGVGSFRTAPFERLWLQARGRDTSVQGVRLGFEGWSDQDPSQFPDCPCRVRDWVTPMSDSTLTATFGGEEVLLGLDLNSPVPSVAAGRVVTTPHRDGDLWFERGADVTLEVEALTGFSFSGWSGDLAGQPNPVALSLDEPVFATAEFELVYGIDGPEGSVTLEGGRAQEIVFQVENATAPVQWLLLNGQSLPPGMSMEPEGRIVGEPMALGDYPIGIQAKDARGLAAIREIVLQVTDPALGSNDLTATFLGTSGGLDDSESRFLDRTGNQNGTYDLGDFRAFLVRNPDLPMNSELLEIMRTFIQLGPVAPPRAGTEEQIR